MMQNLLMAAAGLPTGQIAVDWDYQDDLSRSYTVFGAATIPDGRLDGVLFCSGRNQRSNRYLSRRRQLDLPSTSLINGVGYIYSHRNGVDRIPTSSSRGQGKVATSFDGVTWTYRPELSLTDWGNTTNSSVFNFGWNGSTLLAVGNQGKVATSP